MLPLVEVLDCLFVRVHVCLLMQCTLMAFKIPVATCCFGP